MSEPDENVRFRNAELCGRNAQLAGENILLRRDIETERRRADNWQKLAGRYDDIRYALRNAPDTPEGHAEFYQECAELIFGGES